jgi:hypothetical protein
MTWPKWCWPWKRAKYEAEIIRLKFIIEKLKSADEESLIPVGFDIDNYRTLQEVKASAWAAQAAGRLKRDSA